MQDLILYSRGLEWEIDFASSEFSGKNSIFLIHVLAADDTRKEAEDSRQIYKFYNTDFGRLQYEY